LLLYVTILGSLVVCVWFRRCVLFCVEFCFFLLCVLIGFWVLCFGCFVVLCILFVFGVFDLCVFAFGLAVV